MQKQLCYLVNFSIMFITIADYFKSWLPTISWSTSSSTNCSLYHVDCAVEIAMHYMHVFQLSIYCLALSLPHVFMVTFILFVTRGREDVAHVVAKQQHLGPCPLLPLPCLLTTSCLIVPASQCCAVCCQSQGKTSDQCTSLHSSLQNNDIVNTFYMQCP